MEKPSYFFRGFLDFARNDNKIREMKLVIIDYGAGNTKSVQFALNRLGIEAILTKNAEEIRSADKVIFPGVGHANAAMEKITEAGLEELILV